MPHGKDHGGGEEDGSEGAGDQVVFGSLAAGVEVNENGLVSVRYANVRLGNFADVPNARLRPPPRVGTHPLPT